MILQEEIWSMVYSLIDTDKHEQVANYKGVKAIEAEVRDIVSNIEDLATTIEAKIAESDQYVTSGDAGLDEGDRKCHEMREDGR